jgi:hypothetical protein
VLKKQQVRALLAERRQRFGYMNGNWRRLFRPTANQTIQHYADLRQKGFRCSKAFSLSTHFQVPGGLKDLVDVLSPSAQARLG